MDFNEEKVYNKLRQLNNVVNSKESSYDMNSKNDGRENHDNDASLYNEGVDQAGKMIEKQNQSESEEDPELKQLNRMLDKIMDIQHPERVTEKIKENSLEHKRQVYPVTTNDNQNNYFFPEKLIHLNTGDTNKVNRNSTIKFYSIEDKNIGQSIQNSIQAVINETQTLVSGATVKLRLMNDVYINGILIPKGNFVFGIATMSVDRLTILIKSVLYKNNLLPVNLSVFDLDGIEGIHIPGSNTKTMLDQTTENAFQNIGLNNLNPTISAQAINAGIEAGKKIFTRKIKLEKVTVKAGYQVLLKNNNNDESNF
jgi:conjugative transposon TraM protein